MLLNVGNIVGMSNQIADYDRKHFGSFIEGVAPQSLEEISKIIQKWNNDLFQESYCSLNKFKYIKQFNIDKIKFGESFGLEEKIKIKMLAVHHLAHKLLKENRAPTEQEMEFVHQIFLGFSELFPGESNAEVRANFHQMAIHPNLMIACSESYMKEIAKQIGRSIEYEFSIEPLISRNSGKIQGAPGNFHKILQKWSADLFSDGYYTQEGQALLKGDPKFPDYSKLSYVETWVDTINYVICLVNRKMEYKAEITAEDHKLIANAFISCKERFIQLNRDYNLYFQFGEAAREYDSIALKLRENSEEMKGVVAVLDTRIKTAEGILKEATDCSYYYPRIAPFLDERIQSLTTELEGVKKHKESIVNEGQKKEAELQEQLAMAKIKKESAFKESKKAVVPENLVKTVEESHILELDSLIENAALFADFYQTFLTYAKGRYERELKRLPSEVDSAPASSWYQRFSLW